MNYYRITNADSGVVLGIYLAEDSDHALDTMARDAGYTDYAHACEIAPVAKGEIDVEQVHVAHALNAAGIRAIDRFVSEYGKDGAIPAGWYSAAETAADDAFERDMAPIVEVGVSMSYDGKPHTMTLEQAWFDVREIDA